MVKAALDRNSSVPLYSQLNVILKEEINKGTFDDGPMPSEAELGEQFHVSRTTIRLAMEELVKSGFITRQSGRGTFVIPIKTRVLGGTFTSIYDHFQALGRDFDTRIIDFKVQSAPKEVGRIFNLDPDQDFYFAEMLRITNQEPFILALIYIPVSNKFEITPDKLREHGSAINLFEDLYGVRIVGASRSLEAVVCNQHEADLMNIKQGYPLLMTKTIGYDDRGSPVYYANAKYRSGLYQYYIPFLPRDPIQSSLVEIDDV